MRKQDLKVLLVEDDQSTRSTIRAMLTEMGVTQVFEAKDGGTAQDFVDIDAAPIDIIISDWNMPEKTGYEFLTHLRKGNPSLPFLMITGRGDHNSVSDAIQAGVTGYIKKPFSLNDLESKLDVILKKL